MLNNETLVSSVKVIWLEETTTHVPGYIHLDKLVQETKAYACT